MGQTAAETVREIEQTRDRLEGELRILEERLPSPKEIGKRVAIVAGAAVGVLTMVKVVRVIARRREPEPEMPRAMALALEKLPEGLQERARSIEYEKTKRALQMTVLILTVLAKLRELRAPRTA